MVLHSHIVYVSDPLITEPSLGIAHYLSHGCV